MDDTETDDIIITQHDIDVSTAVGCVVLIITIFFAVSCLCFDGIWTVSDQAEEILIQPVVTRLREEHFALTMTKEKKGLRDVLKPLLKALFSRTNDLSPGEEGDDPDDPDDERVGRAKKKRQKEDRMNQIMEKIEKKYRAKHRRPRELRSEDPEKGAKRSPLVPYTMDGMRNITPELQDLDIAVSNSQELRDIDDLTPITNVTELDNMVTKDLKLIEQNDGLPTIKWDAVLAGEDIFYDEDPDEAAASINAEDEEQSDDEVEENEAEEDGEEKENQKVAEDSQFQAWFKLRNDMSFTCLEKTDFAEATKAMKDEEEEAKEDLQSEEGANETMLGMIDPRIMNEAVEIWTERQRQVAGNLTKGEAFTLKAQTVCRGAWAANGKIQLQAIAEQLPGYRNPVDLVSFNDEEQDLDKKNSFVDPHEVEEMPVGKTWYRLKRKTKMFKTPAFDSEEAGILKRGAVVESWDWQRHDEKWRSTERVVSQYWCVQPGCRKLRNYAFKDDPARFCEDHWKCRQCFDPTVTCKSHAQPLPAMEKNHLHNECTFVDDHGQSCEEPWAYNENDDLNKLKRVCEKHKGTAKKKISQEAESLKCFSGGGHGIQLFNRQDISKPLKHCCKKVDKEEEKQEQDSLRMNACQYKDCHKPWTHSTSLGYLEELDETGKVIGLKGNSYGQHYCKGHGEDFNANWCFFDGCTEYRAYGHEVANGRSFTRFCERHKEEGMIRLDKHNLCEVSGCQNTWIYHPDKRGTGTQYFACKEHGSSTRDKTNETAPFRCVYKNAADEPCSYARCYANNPGERAMYCAKHRLMDSEKVDQSNWCNRRNCKQSWTHAELPKSNDRSASSKGSTNYYCEKHAKDKKGLTSRFTRFGQKPLWWNMLRGKELEERQMVINTSGDRGYINCNDFTTKKTKGVPAKSIVKQLMLEFHANLKEKVPRPFPDKLTTVPENEHERIDKTEKVGVITPYPWFANHPKIKSGEVVQLEYGSFLDREDLVAHYYVDHTLFGVFGALRESPGDPSRNWLQRLFLGRGGGKSNNFGIVFRRSIVSAYPPHPKYLDHELIQKGLVVRLCIKKPNGTSYDGYANVYNRIGELVLRRFTQKEEEKLFMDGSQILLEKRNHPSPLFISIYTGLMQLVRILVLVFKVFVTPFIMVWRMLKWVYRKLQRVWANVKARFLTSKCYMVFVARGGTKAIEKIQKVWEYFRYKLIWLFLYTLIVVGTYLGQVAKMLGTVYLIMKGLSSSVFDIDFNARFDIFDVSFGEVLVSFNTNLDFIQTWYHWIVENVFNNISLADAWAEIFGAFKECNGAQAPAKLFSNVLVATIVVGVFKMEIYSFLTITLHGYFEDVKGNGSIGLVVVAYLATGLLTAIEASFLYAIQLLAQITTIADFFPYHDWSDVCGTGDQIIAMISTICFYIIGLSIWHLLIKTFSKGLDVNSNVFRYVCFLCTSVSSLCNGNLVEQSNTGGNSSALQGIRITPKSRGRAEFTTPRKMHLSSSRSLDTQQSTSGLQRARSRSPTQIEEYEEVEETRDLKQEHLTWDFTAHKMPPWLQKFGFHPSYEGGYPLLKMMLEYICCTCIFGLLWGFFKCIFKLFLAILRVLWHGLKSILISPMLRKWDERQTKQLDAAFNTIVLKVMKTKEWEKVQNTKQYENWHVATMDDVDDAKPGKARKTPKKEALRAMRIKYQSLEKEERLQQQTQMHLDASTMLGETIDALILTKMTYHENAYDAYVVFDITKSSLDKKILKHEHFGAKEALRDMLSGNISKLAGQANISNVGAQIKNLDIGIGVPFKNKKKKEKEVEDEGADETPISNVSQTGGGKRKSGIYLPKQIAGIGLKTNKDGGVDESEASNASQLTDEKRKSGIYLPKQIAGIGLKTNNRGVDESEASNASQLTDGKRKTGIYLPKQIAGIGLKTNNRGVDESEASNASKQRDGKRKSGIHLPKQIAGIGLKTNKDRGVDESKASNASEQRDGKRKSGINFPLSLAGIGSKANQEKDANGSHNNGQVGDLSQNKTQQEIPFVLIMKDRAHHVQKKKVLAQEAERARLKEQQNKVDFVIGNNSPDADYSMCSIDDILQYQELVKIRIIGLNKGYVYEKGKKYIFGIIEDNIGDGNDQNGENSDADDGRKESQYLTFKVLPQETPLDGQSSLTMQEYGNDSSTVSKEFKIQFNEMKEEEQGASDGDNARETNEIISSRWKDVTNIEQVLENQEAILKAMLDSKISELRASDYMITMETVKSGEQCFTWSVATEDEKQIYRKPDDHILFSNLNRIQGKGLFDNKDARAAMSILTKSVGHFSVGNFSFKRRTTPQLRTQPQRQTVPRNLWVPTNGIGQQIYMHPKPVGKDVVFYCDSCSEKTDPCAYCNACADNVIMKRRPKGQERSLPVNWKGNPVTYYPDEQLYFCNQDLGYDGTQGICGTSPEDSDDDEGFALFSRKKSKFGQCSECKLFQGKVTEHFPSRSIGCSDRLLETRSTIFKPLQNKMYEEKPDLWMTEDIQKQERHLQRGDLVYLLDKENIHSGSGDTLWVPASVQKVLKTGNTFYYDVLLDNVSSDEEVKQQGSGMRYKVPRHMLKEDTCMTILNPFDGICNKSYKPPHRFAEGNAIDRDGKVERIKPGQRAGLLFAGKALNMAPMYEMPSFGEIIILLFWCGKDRELGICTVLYIYLHAMIHKMWLFLKLTVGYWDFQLINAVNIERMDYELNCFYKPSEEWIQKWEKTKKEMGETFHYQMEGAEEPIIQSVGRSRALLWQFAPFLTFVAKFGEASADAPIYIGYKEMKKRVFKDEECDKEIGFYQLLGRCWRRCFCPCFFKTSDQQRRELLNSASQGRELEHSASKKVVNAQPMSTDTDDAGQNGGEPSGTTSTIGTCKRCLQAYKVIIKPFVRCYKYLKCYSAEDAELDAALKQGKTKEQYEEEKEDQESGLWEISPLLGNHLHFERRHELIPEEHPCCWGRLFNWSYSMIQYILFMLISFTAITGNLDSLEEEDGASDLIKSKIEDYMYKYLYISFGFTIVNAWMMLNKFFPFSQKMKQAQDIIQETQDSEAGKLTLMAMNAHDTAESTEVFERENGDDEDKERIDVSQEDKKK